MPAGPKASFDYVRNGRIELSNNRVVMPRLPSTDIAESATAVPGGWVVAARRDVAKKRGASIVVWLGRALWFVQPNGKARPLTDDASNGYAVSPDGALLAWAAQQSPGEPAHQSDGRGAG